MSSDRDSLVRLRGRALARALCALAMFAGSGCSHEEPVASAPSVASGFPAHVQPSAPPDDTATIHSEPTPRVLEPANAGPGESDTAQPHGDSGAVADVDDAPMPPRGRPSNASDTAGMDGPALTEFEGSPVELVLELFPDGSPRRRAYVKRNAQGSAVDHGPDWRWFENHQLWLKRVWRDGKQSGPYEEWHEGGFIKTRGAFVDDQRDGVWTSWFDDGAVQSETGWKSGVHDGRSRDWFPNGHPKIFAHWKSGQQDGPYHSWTARGKPTSEGAYVDGQRQGEWREWYEDGRVKSTGRYERDKEVGDWSRVDPKGVRDEEHYKDGLLDGHCASFGPDDKKLSEGDFVQGKAQGLQTTWYESGAKKSEIEYKAGVQHGALRYYFETGAKQMEGTMKDGKKDGEWSYWKTDGTLDPAWSGRYRDDKKVVE